MAAIARGVHRLADPGPPVFDDPYALPLAGEDWRDVHRAMESAFQGPVLRQARAAMVNRARYAEDRLAAGGFTQYVILGAGLDSIAWRRPELLDGIRIFELDHPDTQAWKRARAAELALPEHDAHRLVPVDLGEGSLVGHLENAGVDRSVPTFFSWLGVTQYLPVEAIRATLQAVADWAPRSEIVFTYIPTSEHLDALGQEFVDTVDRVAGGHGEPVQALLTPDAVRDLVERDCGLRIEEHLTRDDLHRRYFADRTDDLIPPTTQRLVAAAVPA
jgi:methyltransferase (TIGR00027 family)